jgi:hypothetical protein
VRGEYSMEYTLEIKSRNGVKEIYFDFAKSNRRAAISLLNDVLKATEGYKLKSTSYRGSTGLEEISYAEAEN